MLPHFLVSSRLHAARRGPDRHDDHARTCSSTSPRPWPTKASAPRTTATSAIDAVAGAIFGDVISLFIIIATGAAIGGSGADQQRPPTPPRRSSRWPAGSPSTCSRLGLFGASALAGAVVPLSTAYAISEAVGVERSVSRRFREAPLFLGLFTGQVVIGAAVALITSNLVQLLLGDPGPERPITPVILAFILVWPTGAPCSATPPTGRCSGSSPRCAWRCRLDGLTLVGQTVLGWFGA